MTPLDILLGTLTIGAAVIVAIIVVCFVIGAINALKRPRGIVDRKTLKKFKNDTSVN